ncbi:PREDICTED: peroxiredoxin-2-like [Polistes canadensis]|uniref:peroxiredoxin-2-like n=1 Tax=Polistes canadensis TaxID=91411 RepID=UPI000718C1B3|nr:PREDICTED: peroxiredoxin-2-like [Polistes canadensis]
MGSCCIEETDKDIIPRILMIPAISYPAPFWSGYAVINSKITELSLKDFKGKYIILLFYPYDFTFVCPTEIIQFSERIDEFRNLNAEVVAISTDSEYSHLAWITTPRKQGGLGEMKIPVLADKNHKISKDYGILDEIRGIAIRALFIIDPKQLIRHVNLNDTAITRSVDEILRLLQACQFADQFGDTCPFGPVQQKRASMHNSIYFDTTLN